MPGFWAGGEAEHHDGRVLLSKAVHLMAARKQSQEHHLSEFQKQ
jgi:hypothetical protein